MARSRQLERLLKRLDDIPKAAIEAVQPALMKSGEELVGTMKQLAPVDTGALKESITLTAAGERTPPYSQPGGSAVVPANAVMITVGNSEVRYPHLVEYGTADAPAQPFFWNSFRLHRKKISNRVKRAVSKAVKEKWKP